MTTSQQPRLPGRPLRAHAPASPPSLPDALSRNRLLSGLSPDLTAALLARAELVPLALREVVYENGGPISHVYFPVSGVLSIVTVVSDGSAVETAMVGREGLAGLPALLGSPIAIARIFAQVPGAALRVSPEVLVPLLREHPAFAQRVRYYALALLAQVSQTAACNRLHEVELRCARWLLMTHDRAEGDRFEVTQDFLAQMLGVRRATVSAAAGALQRAGLIRYRRGRIEVVNRRGLEAASCECYGTVRAHYARLLS